ncbi:hypothetical protein QBC35DRAFT_457036 [Podospora australis]|uniref:Uncharacterized protein n=1 Tax=Podospora australis TaxID=1536484 RepID=A0AAN6WJR9_9PEZI|nr:hypothetical protein QBC35DRAFT_457036 [Podospora australis]
MASVTYIEAKYLYFDMLVTLLETLFGAPSNYRVKMQGDLVEVTAPRGLTDEEISSVTWHE